jgi:hypothetical protein
MHQGLDPKARSGGFMLPWSPSQPLFVSRFLPMSGCSLEHNIPFLKTTNHSNDSKFRKHDLEKGIGMLCFRQRAAVKETSSPPVYFENQVPQIG